MVGTSNQSVPEMAIESDFHWVCFFTSARWWIGFLLWCPAHSLQLITCPFQESKANKCWWSSRFMSIPYIPFFDYDVSWLSGWWFGCHFLFSQKYWVANHPNWRSYFSEGWRNHQPVMIQKWSHSIFFVYHLDLGWYLPFAAFRHQPDSFLGKLCWERWGMLGS